MSQHPAPGPATARPTHTGARHRVLPVWAAGFTLIEVLVALAIVATTLMAGLRASATMTRSAERQSGRVLAQLCAENALVQVRLTQQLPDVGDTVQSCAQAGQTLELRMLVQPTPNPNFRRVQARVSQNGTPLLQVSTVVGRY